MGMPRNRFVPLVVMFLLGGCAFHGTTPSPQTPSLVASSDGVDAVQSPQRAHWLQFTPITNSGLYSAMVEGPDRNVWFLDENGASLVRITPRGNVKEFSLSGLLNTFGVSMAVGADNNFYIGDETSSIIRVSTSGVGVAIPIPSGDGTSIDGMAAGPDGNVWFAEFEHIAKITPAGKITEFAYPMQSDPNQYGGVTAGSDGNVWFAQSSENAIGRIVPSTGKITMFPISASCVPAAVVLAKDKNVWFFCLASSPLLGRITPAGKIKTFPIGGSFSSNETEQFCERGPDGEPWCASGNLNIVFRVNTSSQTITTFNPPLLSGARPDAVTAGRDGTIWVDTVGGQIDVLTNP